MALFEVPTAPRHAHDDESARARHRSELKAAIVGLWVIAGLAVVSVAVFAVLASGFSGDDDAGKVVLPVAVVVLGVLAVAFVRLTRALRAAEPPRFGSVEEMHDALDHPKD